MGKKRSQKGFTLVEVMLAAVIVVIGLVGVMVTVPVAYISVVGSGGQSKAVSYARQQIELLKNQTFPPDNLTGTGTLEGGVYTRSWTITQVAGTTAPNRLWRISVTVTSIGSGRDRTATLETMRAE